MRSEGKTLREIANKFNCSPEYIRIVEKYDLNLSNRGINFSYKGNVTLICNYCKKQFSVVRSRKTTKFCSKLCYNKSIIKMTPDEIRERKRLRQINYYKTEKGNKIIRAILKRQNEKNKIKTYARSVLNNNIKQGLLKRGNCEVCNIPDAQAHHDDYSKPLEVKWFCAFHHKQYHKTYPHIIA